jgi:serine-type D-Ala-D-Ala carboxypeptidase/endopeptidase
VTHISGLPRTPPGFEPRDPLNPYSEFDADALYASLAQTRLARDIGSRYEYSNLGFMWLSELLARRAGKSFDRLMAERIFAPLGMSSTRIGLSRDDEARLVKGHNPSRAIVPRWTIGRDLEGVGLVASSLEDMMRLAEALAGRRSTPLDAAIALALQPPSPRAAPDVGFAWNIRGDGASRRYDHGGGAGGFVAHLAFERTGKTASVVLADAAVSIFDLSIHLVDARYDLRRRLVTVPLDAARRADYLGRFATGIGAVDVREDGGRLIAAVGPHLVVELLHMGDDAFYANAVDAQVFFKRDRSGKVDALTLYLDGRESRGARPGPAQ